MCSDGFDFIGSDIFNMTDDAVVCFGQRDRLAGDQSRFFDGKEESKTRK